ncbi:MAG: hypothetical protein PHF33_05145 [Candidatus Delongbacteria bacterium]|nr:hypothetical protein [Candidatus Delongbacteria bacterium]
MYLRKIITVLLIVAMLFLRTVFGSEIVESDIDSKINNHELLISNYLLNQGYTQEEIVVLLKNITVEDKEIVLSQIQESKDGGDEITPERRRELFNDGLFVVLVIVLIAGLGSLSAK